MSVRLQTKVKNKKHCWERPRAGTIRRENARTRWPETLLRIYIRPVFTTNTFHNVQ